MVLVSAAACACPTSPGTTQDLAPDQTSESDRGAPDRAVSDISPDRVPWIPDLPQHDSSTQPQRVKVLADKAILTDSEAMTPRFYAADGTAHILVGFRKFVRLAADGTVLADKPLPKTSSNRYADVGPLAAGPKGIAALLALGGVHLGMFDRSGNLAANPTKLVFKAKGGIFGFAMEPSAAGFALALSYEDNDDGGPLTVRTELRQFDPAGKPTGTLRLGSDGLNHFFVLSGGKFSGVGWQPNGDLRHATFHYNGSPPGYARHTGLNPKVIVSTGCPFSPLHAMAGDTVWVGFVPSASGVASNILAYNAAIKGKPVFAKERTFAGPFREASCLAAVGTDGDEFLVIWFEGQSRTAGNERVWRAQVFGRDGLPASASQDVALSRSIQDWRDTIRDATTQLIWTGKEFVFFYSISRGPYQGSTRMARLAITPKTP